MYLFVRIEKHFLFICRRTEAEVSFIRWNALIL